MPRIYLPALSVTDNRIVLDGEKAHYLSTVLRCKEGDELTIFDGKGNCFTTVIARADKREVIADVLSHLPCDLESPVHIILVQGLLKGEKMDWVIQKTTELGVREIIPVITERSQVRETRKAARWRKIAEEASRQSGRSVVPTVHEPVELKEFLRRSEFGRHGEAETRRHGEIKGCIFWEDRGTSFNEVVKKISVSPGHPFTVSPIHLLIGPEGGFTHGEVALAEEKSFQVVSLGKRILRAETAALAAVTLVQFLLGDMG
jgi:16S rRNA (uracil1498-N3)-methyltransferase